MIKRIIATVVISGVFMAGAIPVFKFLHAVRNPVDDHSAQYQIIATKQQQIIAELTQLKQRLSRQDVALKHLTDRQENAGIQPSLSTPAAVENPPASADNNSFSTRNTTTPFDDTIRNPTDTNLRYQKMIEHLDNHLVQQEIDPGWSVDMEAKIDAALGDLPTDMAQSHFTQCQATLCAMELTVTERQSDEFLMSFNQYLSGHVGQSVAFVKERRDGNLTMQMYLSRADTTLPSTENEQPAE